MMIVNNPPTPDDVKTICHNLRASDRAQIEATMGGFDAGALGNWLCGMQEYAVAWQSFGTLVRGPIALLGVWEQWPGLALGLLVATDDFKAVALPVARYLKRELPPFLIECGVRRVEVRELAGSSIDRRFVAMLGAKFECYLPLLGAQGQTGAQYAWTNDGGLNVTAP